MNPTVNVINFTVRAETWQPRNVVCGSNGSCRDIRLFCLNNVYVSYNVNHMYSCCVLLTVIQFLDCTQNQTM